MMNKYKKVLGVSLLATALTACGGDDSGSETSSPPVQKADTVLAPMVQDQFAQVVLSEQSRTVSLKSGVSDPQGLPVTLTSVTSITDSCDDPMFDAEAMTFTVDKNMPDVCYYDYTISNHAPQAEQSKSARANSNVLVSRSAVSGALNPISETAMEGNDVTIDLNTELGITTADYMLDDEVVVLGDGSAIADSSTNIITYTAGLKGVSRVLYSLEDGSGDIKAGYIDIAVSGDGNNMPTADNFAGPQNLSSSTPISIDVKDYIDDIDVGDILQLTDVYAYNATVVSAAPTNLDNTVFTFEATAPGSYDVSYYITDHRGGWAVATVQISVAMSPLAWEDITLSNSTVYSAPWDQNRSDTANVFYQAIESETVAGDDYDIVLFNQKNAMSFCLAQGMVLPNRSQLQELYTETGGVGSKNWPVNALYWTGEVGLAEGDGWATDLAKGTETQVPLNSTLIVTCLQPGTLSTLVIVDNAYIDTDASYFNVVRAEVNGKDGPLAGQLVYAYTSVPQARITPQQGITDGNGRVDFEVASPNVTPVPVVFSYVNQTERTDALTFIEDAITGFEVIGSKTPAIGQKPLYTSKTVHQSGAQKDRTTETTWSSSRTDIMTINTNTGVANALNSGATQIKAQHDGRTATIEVEVEEIGIVSLTNSPALVINTPNTTVAIAASAQYNDGTGEDVTESANWTVQPDGYGTISKGVFVPSKGGTVTVSSTIDRNSTTLSDSSTIITAYLNTYTQATYNRSPMANRMTIDALYLDGVSITTTPHTMPPQPGKASIICPPPFTARATGGRLYCDEPYGASNGWLNGDPPSTATVAQMQAPNGLPVTILFGDGSSQSFIYDYQP